MDMHEQLDTQMEVLSDVLSNTNSGSLLRDLNSLHERLQVEIRETFTDFLGSISKDSPKNTGMGLDQDLTVPLRVHVLPLYLEDSSTNRYRIRPGPDNGVS